MNQKLVIGIVAVVLVLAGVGIYSTMNNEKNDAAMLQQEKMENEAIKNDEGVMMNKTDTVVKQDAAMMTQAGSYESYEIPKIAMASATHDVVLFFKASWCPTCKAVDADIKAHLKDIPPSLTILDVNYDNSTELKKKYGVTYQHTFVQVDGQGKLIKKWSGSPTLASLVSEVK